MFFSSLVNPKSTKASTQAAADSTTKKETESPDSSVDQLQDWQKYETMFALVGFLIFFALKKKLC